MRIFVTTRQSPNFIYSKYIEKFAFKYKLYLPTKEELACLPILKQYYPCALKKYPDTTGSLVALMIGSKKITPVSQLTFMGNMPINESRFDSKKICDYFGWEKSRWNVKLEREIINLYFAWQEYDNA